MHDDAPHRLPWPRIFVRAAAFVLLAVMVYALSLGPVLYLFEDRSRRANRTIDQFYDPIDWLIVQSRSLDPLVAYLSWWRALPGGPEDRYRRRKGSPLPSG